MSTRNPETSAQGSPPPAQSAQEIPADRTVIVERYRGSSQALATSVRLVTDLERDPVRVRAKVRDPIALREALSVLHETVRSDLSYKPRDRSGYLAFRRMRSQSSGLSVLAARREHFAWLARNDPLAWIVLDPVVTVHPDAIVFEVFSKDEATYAQLSIDRGALSVEGDWVCGTTHVDFTDALHEGLQRIRGQQSLLLELGTAAEAPAEEGIVEKRLLLPDSWLRGLLQASSALALAGPGIPLQVVDLYSLLRQLRLRRDRPGAGRALRVELVPGEVPKLVLEPWEQLFLGQEPYAGLRPEVVRVWGRRRWLLARRLLPFVGQATLHLVGSGLPSFLVLRAGPLTLTLGLTGFLASDWSRALQLDACLPRPGLPDPVPSQPPADALLSELARRQVAPVEALAEALGRPPNEIHNLRARLREASQKGTVLFDLASGLVRWRPLLGQPVDPERMRFRNDRERQATDLLAQGAVQHLREEARFGSGTELVATVLSPVDRREYRTRLALDEEGRVVRADCTCNHFRTHGLKEGPCPHLLALRMAQTSQQKSTLETRTFARRQGTTEQITQLSLDRLRLKIRWGQRSDERLRVQSLVFDTEEEARAAYLGRIARLERNGWLDAGRT